MAGVRLNGKACGIDPNDPQHRIYTNRDVVGPWEDVTVKAHERWSDILFDAAKRQLCVNQQTGQLESRPAGEIGGWGGQWDVVRDNNAWVAKCANWTLALEGYAPVQKIHLEQRGNDFVDAAGNRVVIPACDMFLALRQWRDGGPDALAPFIAESHRLGFLAWRIWSQGSKAQNTVFDLSPREAGYYDSVRPFAAHLNANGLIPLLTGYVDNQDVKSPLGHWVELGARLQGTQTLLSGFNQWSKNKSDFDPWALPTPAAGLIWSRGSDVEDIITDPRGAPASELHATRNSFDRALMDSTASPPFMRAKGAGMVWMTEGQPFGDGNGYSEAQAWQLGRGYSILWSLAVFHNRFSQRMLLMDDATARCAAAWVRGMRID